MTEESFREHLSQVTARLTQLEDIAEIQDLHRSYVRRLADRDWECMLDDFLPDAILSLRGHGARRGRDEIAQLFGAMRAADSPPDSYLLTSPAIEVDGRVARGRWTWQRHFTELPVMGGAVRITGPWWAGDYNTLYRKVAGRWKFAQMYFRLVAPRPDADAQDILSADLTLDGDR